MPKSYFIDNIEGRRIRNGRIEYYVKWLGYCREFNTWEPEENIFDSSLVQNFERSLQMNQRKGLAADAIRILKRIRGFDHYLKPQQILGATKEGGSLLFLMKWRGVTKPDFVLAQEANVRCPKIVIAFYEKNIKFVDISS